MLVVTANWGCADGTLVPAAAGRAAVRRWFAAIHRGIVRAGFRRDGRYEPVDAVDLVFAGDTCDWLVSETWLGKARPWHGGRRAREARARVALTALRRAAPLAAWVARWLREGVAVPRADGRARPARDGWARVPVRVALLAGDRDPWLHEVFDTAGLAGCSSGTGWGDGAVAVRHGHEFDPACRVEAAASSERPPSLAESVAVDLVAAFLAACRALGLGDGAAGRLAVALAAAGPLDLPVALGGWLESEAARGTLAEAVRDRIAAEWRRAVSRWHRAADLAPPACGLPASPHAALATWLERAVDDPLAGRRRPGPPASVADLARSTPQELATAAAAVSTRGTVVLGHPSGGRRGGGGCVSQVVCLGAATGPRWRAVSVVAVGLDRVADVAPVTGPVAVAARAASGRLEWVPLGPDVRDGLEAESAHDRSGWIVDAA
jgi:hypothetical protein